MTNREKFKEVFGRDLKESRMLSMPSSFNQIITLKSFQIEGVDCADEWKESEYQGEPTIPLSVIEKIHDAIDNADCDACLEDENGSYTEEVFTREHIHEIIYKAVKECTHDKG